MANAIPQQFNRNHELIYDADNSLTRRQIDRVLCEILGNQCEIISFYKRQKISTAHYENYYFIVANITSMGGQEGQHPSDLKRIQYNYNWRKFYEEYSIKGTVIWLGLYSYDGQMIFGFFDPRTYLSKHEGTPLLTKKGDKSNYSCHIYLNDLYQGDQYGYYEKKDKNGNRVGAISANCLKKFLSGALITNPIITTIEKINQEMIPWNKWVDAKTIIPYMKKLKSYTGFQMWKQNLWNGWCIEAFYSHYLHDHPSKYVVYIGTTSDKKIKEEYGEYGLDLALFDGTNCFVGDLKAVNYSSGDTLLNDENKVIAALDKYKKIWFVFYLHQKKPGSYNDYEMVKWRNHFIYKSGEWNPKKPFDEQDAPNSPHSVCFDKCVVVEMNEITKERYFAIGNQYGLNSDGNERNRKFTINKSLLIEEIINDDGLVIYRNG